MLAAKSWSFFLERVLLPLGDAAFRQGMMKRLRHLQQAQWWDPERLETCRNRSLATLASVAYHEVPFYRDLFDSAGVRPGVIRSPGDLRRLPVTGKAMMRRNYPERVTRPTGLETYEASSSGSTGSAFVVLEDAQTAGMYRACFLLALQWAGWHIGDPHLQLGMTLNRNLQRRLKDSLLGCHYFSAFVLKDAELENCLRALEQSRLQHVWGYPGAIYYLARYARRQGWNTPLRSVVTWGDNLLPHYRLTIEQAFRCRVHDTYGCGEGIQVGAQCGAGGYHMHTLDTVVEFLDDDDEPAAPGVPANVVLTRLHPGPMPFIRYRVGDLATSAGDHRCPCGRGFDCLESIQGRDTDVILTPSGNRLIVHFFTGILEHFRELDAYQVVQEELDRVVVRVVPAPGCDMTPSLAARICRTLQDHGAQDLRFEIEAVSEIAVPVSNKRRFVISRLPRAETLAG